MAPVSRDLEAALAAAFEQGRALHAGCELAREDFDAQVIARTRRRLERAGVASDDAQLARAIERLAAADLYLALACDAARPGAWERLDALHRPKLSESARRSGADAELAADVAADVLAELCAPRPDASARTRLGRYDGAGSLDAWLSLVARHRLLDRRRAREEQRAPAHEPEDPRTRTPADAAITRESAASFTTCLRQAFARLTPKESLAVQFRYADDLPQTRIAGLLGIGEPRVSRLVQAAIGKLREFLRRCWRFLVAEGGGARPLADLLHEVLAGVRGKERP